ncbi:cytochrome P450 [Mycena latifolia]|nr:cytochrome P450 [Mycena latifolia]
MDSQDSKTLLIYGLAPVLVIAGLRSREQSTIPTIATPGFLASYLPAVHFMFHAKDILHQGYNDYRDGVFRVRRGRGIQSDYTIGPEGKNLHVTTAAIRGALTRNLGRCFPEVRDEIVNAFDDILALDDNEWKEIKVSPSLMQVVARTSNCLFVGLPLCRDKDLELNINYTVDIFTRGQIIGLLSELLKPILAPLISTRKSSRRHALTFLGPMIDERLENERTMHGRNWPDKPVGRVLTQGAHDYPPISIWNDLITWLLENAEGKDRTTPSLTVRIFEVNMAAIHTSSMVCPPTLRHPLNAADVSQALTVALYDLTTYPEHILPMREEAERVIEADGWNKASLGKMHKIDSFLRESQRLTGNGAAIALLRKVVAKEGFTFSDGAKIPYGAFVGIPGLEMQYDPDNYQNPITFDGFRFSRMREQRAGPDVPSEGASFFNRHMVTTGQDPVVFGPGPHACPGRFFAATELKAMLARVLLNYDVKAKTEGVRPPDMGFGSMTIPNLRGIIMMRKRA